MKHAKFLFLQNDKLLLGYILKASGHTCVHIVNLSALPIEPVQLAVDSRERE